MPVVVRRVRLHHCQPDRGRTGVSAVKLKCGLARICVRLCVRARARACVGIKEKSVEKGEGEE
jgi:hypothetical protein